MNRVKIDLPNNFHYETQLTIQITDLNYGGHMGNDRLLAYLHEARVRFLESMNYTELDVEGASLIMADSAIAYKSEGFHKDVLKIHVAVGEIGTAGFELFYKVDEVSSGRLVAEAKTGMVFFDYTDRKVISTPEAFKLQFEKQD